MKKIIKSLFLILLFTTCLVACAPVPQRVPMQDKFPCISIEQANVYAKKAGEAGTKDAYYVYGKVKAVTNPLYGEMIIEDSEKNTLSIYKTVGEDGTPFEQLQVKPCKGDEVVLYGKLKTFNDKVEMSEGSIKAFEHYPVIINPAEYETMSIAAARKVEGDKNVSLTGVVAKITYGNPMIKNGFFLVDDTACVFVYGKEAAGQVVEGNKVTIVGTKTNYVNPREANSAEKHNYPGSLQITDVAIVSNDGNINPYNTEWITETSILNLIENDNYNEVTGNIYKVRGIISRNQGAGFVNYYINDIDGKTGSYCYSSNDGKDFEYLKQYDGKACEILLSVINCKCTDAAVVRRFVPIAVTEKPLDINEAEYPEIVYNYYVKNEMISELPAGISYDLVSSATNEYIDLSQVKIAYEVTTPEILAVEGSTLKAIKEGAGKVNIVITYKEFTFTKEISVNVTKGEVKFSTVDDAVKAVDNTEVTVKGVVLSSLVNRTGFYLIDNTGVIAVTMTTEELAKVNIGEEVIVSGLRIHKKKNPDNLELAGQSVITDAVVLQNNHGNHGYSTELFDKTETIDTLVSKEVKNDLTTKVYVVNAIIKVIEGGYATTIHVVSTTNPEIDIRLYCSSAKQYAFLQAYKDQEVSLELALCNWNDKSYYTGCVISVTANGQKTMNTLNFNN